MYYDNWTRNPFQPKTKWDRSTAGLTTAQLWKVIVEHRCWCFTAFWNKWCSLLTYFRFPHSMCVTSQLIARNSACILWKAFWYIWYSICLTGTWAAGSSVIWRMLCSDFAFSFHVDICSLSSIHPLRQVDVLPVARQSQFGGRSCDPDEASYRCVAPKRSIEIHRDFSEFFGSWDPTKFLGGLGPWNNHSHP